MLKQHLHKTMETVPGCNMNGGLPLAVLCVELGTVVDEKHGCRLVGLQGSTVEQGVPRARIEDVAVCPSRYELGGKRGIILSDVIGCEVGRVQVGQR